MEILSQLSSVAQSGVVSGVPVAIRVTVHGHPEEPVTPETVTTAVARTWHEVSGQPGTWDVECELGAETCSYTKAPLGPGQGAVEVPYTVMVGGNVAQPQEHRRLYGWLSSQSSRGELPGRVRPGHRARLGGYEGTVTDSEAHAYRPAVANYAGQGGAQAAYARVPDPIDLFPPDGGGTFASSPVSGFPATSQAGVYALPYVIRLSGAQLPLSPGQALPRGWYASDAWASGQSLTVVPSAANGPDVQGYGLYGFVRQSEPWSGSGFEIAAMPSGTTLGWTERIGQGSGRLVAYPPHGGPLRLTVTAGQNSLAVDLDSGSDGAWFGTVSGSGLFVAGTYSGFASGTNENSEVRARVGSNGHAAVSVEGRQVFPQGQVLRSFWRESGYPRHETQFALPFVPLAASSSEGPLSQGSGRLRYAQSGSDVYLGSENAGSTVVFQGPTVSPDPGPGRAPRTGSDVVNLATAVSGDPDFTATTDPDQNRSNWRDRVRVRMPADFVPASGAAVAFLAKGGPTGGVSVMLAGQSRESWSGATHFVDDDGDLLVAADDLAAAGSGALVRVDGDLVSFEAPLDVRSLRELHRAVNHPSGLDSLHFEVARTGQATALGGFVFQKTVCWADLECDGSGVYATGGAYDTVRQSWFRFGDLGPYGGTIPAPETTFDGWLGWLGETGAGAMSNTSAAYAEPITCGPNSYTRALTAAGTTPALGFPYGSLPYFLQISPPLHWGTPLLPNAVEDGGSFAGSTTFRATGIPLGPADEVQRAAQLGAEVANATLEFSWTGMESQNWSSSRSQNFRPGVISDNPLPWTELQVFLNGEEQEYYKGSSLNSGTAISRYNGEIPQFVPGGNVAFVLVGRRRNSVALDLVNYRAAVLKSWAEQDPPYEPTAAELAELDRTATANVDAGEWVSFGSGVAVGAVGLSASGQTTVDVTDAVRAITRAAPQGYTDFQLFPVNAGATPGSDGSSLASLAIACAPQESFSAALAPQPGIPEGERTSFRYSLGLTGSYVRVAGYNAGKLAIRMSWPSGGRFLRAPVYGGTAVPPSGYSG